MLLPHVGFVDLVRDPSAGSAVVHRLTQERVNLDGPEWYLCFDDLGNGHLQHQISCLKQSLNDRFRCHPVRDISGEVLVLDNSSGNGGEYRTLDSLMLLSGTYKVAWTTSGGAEYSSALSIVAVPRGGCSAFFDLKGLYESLGYPNYSSLALGWVGEGMAASKRCLEAFGYSDKVLFPRNDKLTKLGSKCHILPFMGANTVAFLLNLVTLCDDDMKMGGLPSVDAKVKCVEILDGLCRCLASDTSRGDGWEIHVVFACDLSLGSSMASEAPAMTLPVTREGIVHLRAWRAAENFDGAADSALPQQWLSSLLELGIAPTLGEILRHCGRRRHREGAQALFVQILAAVVSRLESFFDMILAGGQLDPDFKIKVMKCDETGVGLDEEEPRDVDDGEYGSVSQSANAAASSSAGRSAEGGGAEVGAQVCSAFTESEAAASAETAEEKQAVAAEQNQRHEQWIALSKGSGSSRAQCGWKPRKVNRQEAAKFCKNLDNQVRTIGTHGGLAYWHKDDEDEKWADFRLWPHMTVCTDRGSDNFAGIHALMYKPTVQLCVSPWWDGSHDAWRSVLEAIRGIGCFGFIIMVMIVCNLPHGPDATDMRFGQLRDASEALFKVHSHTSCKLFGHHLNDLVKEYKGPAFSGTGTGAEADVWEMLRSFSLYRNKKYKVNLNRFQSVVREGKALLERWFSTLMVAEYTALECNMLSNASLKAKLRVRNESDADASTSATSVDTKAIRSCAQNALVVTVLTLQEKKHHRMLSIICACAAPIDKWHHDQNVEARDVKRGAAWAIQQVSGAYMSHVSEVLRLPTTESLAVACGFGTPGGETSKFKWSAEDIMAEDEYAELAGKYCMMLVVARLNRFIANLCSWPWSMLRILDSELPAQAVVDEFKADYDAYQVLKRAVNPTKDMKLLLQRSQFNLLSVQQLVLACVDSNWEASDVLIGIMRQRSLTIFGSQICEDLNNVQKNDKSIAGCQSSGQQHFRRPESSFAAGILRGVVDKVHRFDRPALRTAVVRRTAALEQNCFRSSHSSLPFHTIAGTSSKPDYWSPSPAHASAPAGDHKLLQVAVAEHDIAEVSAAWLASWCEAKNKIVFKMGGGEGLDGEWFMAIHCLDRSSCLVWPVALDSHAFNDGSVLVTPLDLARPKLMAILSLEGIVGFTYSWRSWAWQRAKARGGLRPGIRAVKSNNTPIEAILKVCARNAWFDMGRSLIQDYQEHMGLPKTSSSSLFDVVFEACRDTLGTGDSTVMELMSLRFANLSAHTEYLGDLMEVDEAQACLDDKDRGELKKMQEGQADRALERKEFVEKLREQRKKLRAAASSNGNKKRKVEPTVKYNGPRRMPEPGREKLSQQQLKQMLPPKCYIWVARTISAWCTRCPPMKQRTVCWRTAGGEDAAAREALADVWQKYLDKEGLDTSDCPIAGLLTQAAGGAAASSSSA